MSNPSIVHHEVEIKWLMRLNVESVGSIIVPILYILPLNFNIWRDKTRELQLKSIFKLNLRYGSGSGITKLNLMLLLLIEHKVKHC